MLNEYQLQFLRNFTDFGVRLLVIGGQARHVHNGSVTRDLDLWVAIDPEILPADCVDVLTMYAPKGRKAAV